MFVSPDPLKFHELQTFGLKVFKMRNVGEFAGKHEAQQFGFGDHWNIDTVEGKQKVLAQFSLH